MKAGWVKFDDIRITIGHENELVQVNFSRIRTWIITYDCKHIYFSTRCE